MIDFKLCCGLSFIRWCGKVVNFVISLYSIYSCFHWYKKCKKPTRNVGVMVQNKVAHCLWLPV